ncbi:hypothetical protein FGB62_155g010 [Gracilaria domingensis]|nr:hypothetical protein FGB62_155g010 [Gracilaria domingensis]
MLAACQTHLLRPGAQHLRWRGSLREAMAAGAGHVHRDVCLHSPRSATQASVADGTCFVRPFGISAACGTTRAADGETIAVRMDHQRANTFRFVCHRVRDHWVALHDCFRVPDAQGCHACMDGAAVHHMSQTSIVDDELCRHCTVHSRHFVGRTSEHMVNPARTGFASGTDSDGGVLATGYADVVRASSGLGRIVWHDALSAVGVPSGVHASGRGSWACRGCDGCVLHAVPLVGRCWHHHDGYDDDAVLQRVRNGGDRLAERGAPRGD